MTCIGTHEDALQAMLKTAPSVRCWSAGTMRNGPYPFAWAAQECDDYLFAANVRWSLVHLGQIDSHGTLCSSV